MNKQFRAQRNQSNVFPDDQYNQNMDMQAKHKKEMANLQLQGALMEKNNASKNKELVVMQEKQAYREELQRMQSEVQTEAQILKNSKVQRQKELRAFLDIQMAEKANTKNREKQMNELKSQEYKRYLEDQDYQRQNTLQQRRSNPAEQGRPAPRNTSPGCGIENNAPQQPQQFQAGLNIGEIKDVSKNEKLMKQNQYHVMLDNQVNQRKQAEFSKKNHDLQENRDSLDAQLTLQNRFDDQRKSIEHQRKAYHNEYLKRQPQMDDRKKPTGNEQGDYRELAFGTPSQMNPEQQQHHPAPVRLEPRPTQKPMVGGDASAKQIYNEIKRNYGNHSSDYNILTGERN